MINLVFHHSLAYYKDGYGTHELVNFLSHNKLKMMEKGVLMFKGKEGIFGQNPLRWSWRESNPRPNIVAISFLHA